MSDNKELSLVDRIKELPNIKSNSVGALSRDIKGLKNKIDDIGDRLRSRKAVIKEIEADKIAKEDAANNKAVVAKAPAAKVATSEAAPITSSETPAAVKKDVATEKTTAITETKAAESAEVKVAAKSDVASEAKTEVKAEVSPKLETSATDKVAVSADKTTSDASVKSEAAATPAATTPAATTAPKTFIPNNNRPNGGYNNNNRPTGTGTATYNNRPTGTGTATYNNRPTGTGTATYNNRPTGTGTGTATYNRPAGTGYNNNSGGGYNNNRPAGTGYNNNTGGGYNNNRPAGGGYNNGGVPRLPRADLTPPPITKDTQKKKKPFESAYADKRNPRARGTGVYARRGFGGGMIYDEDTVRHQKLRKIKKVNDFTPNTVNIEVAYVNSKFIPVKILAEKIGKQSTEIIKKLFHLGQMITINDVIEFDAAELLALEFGITLEYRPDETAEDKLNKNVVQNTDEGDLIKRPPVVTIMGHVDHGKTSLLDFIRNTKVASTEAGGITQHIGAYTIDVRGEQITFLDTPGHEAFTTMRKRGAMVTDIAVIVVAGDDGFMPQTIEAVSHAKEAGVSVMIAITKMDKTTVNSDKVLQQMAQYGLTPEAWGGETMVCEVSAKTGAGIDSLLDSIILQAEVKELVAVRDCRATGSIIEARLDKGVGPVATCLIQSGTLKVADYVVAGTVVGKVRAILDNANTHIMSAGPSVAVSVHGFSEVPNAGDQLIVVENEKLAKQVAQERSNKEREDMHKKSSSRSLEDMFKNYSATEKKSLGVVIKGDVQGSVEAVRQELIKLGEEMFDDGVVLTIMHSAVGPINESDVMLANTGNAVVIGFNVRPEPKAKILADRNSVDVKIYRVIYDVIDDIRKAMKGMLDPIFREEVLGHAEVREIFRITGVGVIAGSYVTDGKMARNAKFRLIRDNVVVYDGSITSMKRNKDEVKEVASGFECGIGLEGYNEMKVGDSVEAFLLIEEER